MNFELKAPATQYGLVTLSYWAFTLSDGALRMLVVLFFHQLGYSPIEIAGLLVLYELCGVITLSAYPLQCRQAWHCRLSL